MKSKKMKARNIPKNQNTIDTLTNKTYLFLFFVLLMGIVVSFKFIYVGIIFITFSLFMLLMKKIVVIAFYDDYVVFYLDKMNENVYILYLDEIINWMILNHKRGIEIKVTLKNQETITLNCTTKLKVLKYFKTKLKAYEKTKSC